jgi:hypothetical protein
MVRVSGGRIIFLSVCRSTFVLTDFEERDFLFDESDTVKGVDWAKTPVPIKIRQ